MSLAFNHINDDLLVKHLLREATEEERILVEEWIATNPANRKYYEHLETIWNESRRLAANSNIDEEAAWARFRSRITQPTKASPVRRMNSRVWMRAAAVFLVIVGVAYMGYSLLGQKPAQSIIVASTGAPLMDTLPDGSVVTLNKNSELEYPSRFKADERNVALKGEAFFNVTPNKEKPFIIRVNDVTIRVVGTSFNVRSANGVTEVIVETGIVRVTHKNKMVELRKDEKVKVQQQDTSLAKDKVQDRLYNYYRSKEFVCDNTPLWKFVEILNEAYDAHIVIEDPKVRGLLLTAPFDNQSLDRILDVIHETFNITVIKETDRIILR